MVIGWKRTSFVMWRCHLNSYNLIIRGRRSAQWNSMFRRARKLPPKQDIPRVVISRQNEKDEAMTEHGFITRTVTY
jgi:hypothetical protein